jgi:hypothetical protein
MRIRTISSVRPKAPIVSPGRIAVTKPASFKEQIKNVTSTQVFSQFERKIERVDGAQNLLQTRLGPERYKKALEERQREMNGGKPVRK